jgi:hypothetical protein
MLRELGVIAVCLCIATAVGCDSGNPVTPTPAPASAPPTVTVDFGGRVVNAESGGGVENVRVTVEHVEYSNGPDQFPNDVATTAGDGTFTLPLSLQVSWQFRYVFLKLIAPPGYDDRYQLFETAAASNRPEIRMYPTLVIRPGESIDVRVDGAVVWCGWDGYPCRRVQVAASPGQSVELEVVSHDSSKRMALGLAVQANPYNVEPNMSVRRLTVPPGGVPFVIAEDPTGIATLTARR